MWLCCSGDAYEKALELDRFANLLPEAIGNKERLSLSSLRAESPSITALRSNGNVGQSWV